MQESIAAQQQSMLQYIDRADKEIKKVAMGTAAQPQEKPDAEKQTIKEEDSKTNELQKENSQKRVNFADLTSTVA